MTLATSPWLEEAARRAGSGRRVTAATSDGRVLLWPDGRARRDSVSSVDFSFLLAMHRVAWGTRVDRVSALEVDPTLVLEALAIAVPSTWSGGPEPEETWRARSRAAAVRAEWEPDRDPQGEGVAGYALRLVLAEPWSRRIATESRWVDLTDFVETAAENARPSAYWKVVVLVESTVALPAVVAASLGVA